MEHMDVFTTLGVWFVVAAVEVALGVYHNSKRRRDDWINDVLGIGQLALVYKPLIVLLTGPGLASALPGLAGALAGVPIFPSVYPNTYGVEDDPLDHWSTQWLYPLLKAKNPASEHHEPWFGKAAGPTKKEMS